MGLVELLMASTATFCSEEVRETPATSKIRSPVKRPALRPAGLSAMTFLMKIPELPPSTFPRTIEMPKLTPGSLITFTTLFGPQTLAGSELLVEDDEVP